MSDRVALVNDGNIVQEGAPRDVYLRPADSFAANFLGRTNLLGGQGQPFVLLDEGRDLLVRVPSERCYILEQPAAVAR